MGSNTSVETNRGAQYISVTKDMEYFDSLPPVLRAKLNEAEFKHAARDVWNIVNLGLPHEQRSGMIETLYDDRVAACVYGIDLRDQTLTAKIQKDLIND